MWQDQVRVALDSASYLGFRTLKTSEMKHFPLPPNAALAKYCVLPAQSR